MKVPHKHAAIIKAWADGAEIEMRNGQYSEIASPWRAINNNDPNWNAPDRLIFRVKPEPHKWQKEIDAYVAGKVVEYRANENCPWRALPGYRKYDKNELPEFRFSSKIPAEFRIKPEETTMHCYAVPGNVTYSLFVEEMNKLNLKLTFVDGRLTGAEVIA